MYCKGLFVASTGQHVGKTTACPGLFSGLRKRLSRICYMKPVGQEHILNKKGSKIDKDVLIFKKHFALKAKEEEMSPVVIPQGFTRDFIDGKIKGVRLREKIQKSFQELSAHNTFLVAEGTGHCGVGSVIDLNNAQVASLLGIPVLLVASGGLGSAFDELALNKAICDAHQVPVIGVLLNRVLPEKKKMVVRYMSQALERWKVPLIGCIPYDSLLSHPTMEDFESLFQKTLETGEKHRLRHFKHIRLVATSVETYRELIVNNQLIITPANREDIILATLTQHWEYKIAHPGQDLESGMILTGDHPPRHLIVEEIRKADIPMLYIPVHSHTAVQMIHSFTAKIRTEDVEKVHEAIEVVENHIDFDLLDSLLRAHARTA